MFLPAKEMFELINSYSDFRYSQNTLFFFSILRINLEEEEKNLHSKIRELQISYIHSNHW